MGPGPSNEPEWINSVEAARILGLDDAYVRRLAKRGDLPCEIVQRDQRVRYRFNRADIEEHARARAARNHRPRPEPAAAPPPEVPPPAGADQLSRVLGDELELAVANSRIRALEQELDAARLELRLVTERAETDRERYETDQYRLLRELDQARQAAAAALQSAAAALGVTGPTTPQP